MPIVTLYEKVKPSDAASGKCGARFGNRESLNRRDRDVRCRRTKHRKQHV